MNKQEILKTAKNIIGDLATLSIHKGLNKEWAIQITGCFPDQADECAKKLMDYELPYSAFRRGAGYAYLWMQ